MRVKICGITNLEDAEAAAAAGADALGFILYEKSKRFIAIEDAVRIVEMLPPFVQTVAVTVNASREFTNLGWRKLLKNFGAAQLHGEESPAHVKAVGKYLPVIKVFPADMAKTVTPGQYEVSAFMLDTPSKEHGGTGRVYDWNLAVEFKKRITKPLILSGGLNPENVARAIETVQPYAVDASSGVEASPGRKDHDQLRKFIRICKSF
ncbi:MAG TPA: phosphoribosylanthranilate isomerase [Candidatus Methylacidiphilales bacterium]|jgi:phosphoribosylanthranilate isomerase|nr:phosphoribosylanthranilate isomerase [Candidatus Methylacidiphilales bacterium]